MTDDLKELIDIEIEAIAHMLRHKNANDANTILDILNFVVRHFSEKTQAYAIVLVDAEEKDGKIHTSTAHKSAATPETVNRQMLTWLANDVLKSKDQANDQ